MSLEIALAENTAAMKELTALLRGAALPPVVSAEVLTEAEKATLQPGNIAPVGAKKLVKAAEKVEPPKAEEPAPTAAEPDGAPPMVTDENGDVVLLDEPAKLTYDDVQKAVKTAAMRSRAKVLEVYAGFKIKHASEAKPAQWPALKDALDKIIAEAP